MKKVLSTLLAATLLLTTVTGLQSLSVSAEEGAAGIATSKELIANGDFEGADTIVLSDDFEGATAKTDWGHNTQQEALIGSYVQESKVAAIARPIAHEVTLKSNTAYALSFKLKTAGNTGGIAATVCEDVRTADGILQWGKINGVGGIYDAANKASVDKDGDAFTCPGKWVGWNVDSTTEWTTKSFEFTTATINSNKDYFIYFAASYSVYIDDVQLTEKFKETENVVKGYSTVTDPAEQLNHCIKLNTWNVPYVNNFAVESNTYYRFSYDYKCVDGADYSSRNYQQLYCKVLNAANNEALSLYSVDGTALSGNAVSSYSDNLIAAVGWKHRSVIFKTGEVADATYKFNMTVTGGAMYADNFSVTKLVSDSEVSADFGFIGTAIKATPEAENNQQLRFKAQVNKAALAAGYYNGFTVTEYGFLAFRKDYLANPNSELTLKVNATNGTETKETTVLKRPAYVAGLDGTATTDIVFSEDATTRQFYARLIGFKPENYDKTYLVRTYAKLRNADGVELTVYVSETTGLGVYDLAYTAFTATNDDGSYAESFDVRTVLYSLLKNSNYSAQITEPVA